MEKETKKEEKEKKKTLAPTRRCLKFQEPKNSNTDEIEAESSDEDIPPPPLLQINKNPGEFVCVRYDGQVFPGLIIKVESDGATVKAMKKNGQLWKWPERDDVLKYCWDDILGKATPRQFSSRRLIFTVPELERYL